MDIIQFIAGLATIIGAIYGMFGFMLKDIKREVDLHEKQYEEFKKELRQMNERFESFNARLDSYNTRFDSFNARLDAYNNRFDSYNNRLEELYKTLIDITHKK